MGLFGNITSTLGFVLRQTEIGRQLKKKAVEGVEKVTTEAKKQFKERVVAPTIKKAKKEFVKKREIPVKRAVAEVITPKIFEPLVRQIKFKEPKARGGLLGVAIRTFPGELARLVTRIGLEGAPETQLARLEGRPEPSIIPPNELSKTLIGEEPITPLGSGPVARGAGSLFQKLGAKPETAQKFGLGISAALGGIIESPFGVTGKAGKEIGEEALEKVAKKSPEILKATAKLLDEVPQVFNLKKFNLDEVGEKLIKEAFEKTGLQTRKVKSFEKVAEQARKVNIDKVLAGRTKDIADEEVLALSNFINNAAKRAGDLGKNIEKFPENQFEIDFLTEQIEKAVSKQVKAGTAAGRQVVAFRILARDNMEPSFWIRQAKKQLGDRELTEKVISQINLLTKEGDAAGLSEFVANLGKVSWLEKLSNFRKAGLLASVKTDLKNIASNTVFKLLDDVTDAAVGNAMDKMASLFTKKRSLDIDIGDALKSWAGFSQGAKQGLDFLKTGVDRSAFVGSKIEYRKAFNRFSDNPIERTLAKYTNTLFNRLEAEDKPFKAMAYIKSLREQGKIKGKAQGLRGKNLSDFIDNLMENPTKEMNDLGIRQARDLTFQAENVVNDLWVGALQKMKNIQTKVKTTPLKNRAAQRLREEVAALPQFIMEMVNPFSKVSSNLFLKGLDFTPAGFVRGAFSALTGNQKQLVKASSRATVGSAIMAGLWKWNDSNENVDIKLRDLETSKERKLRFRKGEQGNAALRIGKFSVGLQGIDPIPIFFLGAELLDKVKSGEISYKDAAIKYSENRLDETYIKGLRDLLNVPTYGMDYFLKQQVSSFVPTIVGQLAKTFDNNIRGYDTTAEAIMSRIPVIRGNLQPKLDAFGNEIKYNQDPVLNAVNQLLSPFGISKVKINAIDKELQRLNEEDPELNVLPVETGKTLTVKGERVPLSQEEVNAIQKVRGTNIWVGLGDLFKSKEYRKADNTTKASMLNKVYTKARNEAKKRISVGIVTKKDLEPIAKLDFLISTDMEKAAKFFNANKDEIDLTGLSPSKRKRLAKEVESN